jgi:hypothetical protein
MTIPIVIVIEKTSLAELTEIVSIAFGRFEACETESQAGDATPYDILDAA